VTSVFNSAGGTGSAGGTVRPGGPATLAITLDVIPATTTLNVPRVATTVPVPAGHRLHGAWQLRQGPAPGAIVGCITGIIQGSLSPAHGTLTTVGSGLRYTPNAGFGGTDTFQYQAVGTNTDGINALNSGNVTVTTTVTMPSPASVPTLGTWGRALLGGLLLLFGAKAAGLRHV
jgi:hypothetical protein